MHTILPHIRQHFDGLTHKLEAFAEHAVQVESWFKGECLALAMILQKLEVISSFDRERKSPIGGRIDLYLEHAGQRHWIELKHWLPGPQNDGSFYPCANYLCNDGVCLGDVQKLGSIADLASPQDRAWFWLFMTRNPRLEDWTAAVEKFNERHARYKLKPVTNPNDFPDSWFLGLAEVLRPSQALPTTPPTDLHHHPSTP